MIDTKLLNKETKRECLTSSQAKQSSGLSTVYLASLLRKGTLDGFKIDNDWFIYVDSLEQFLKRTRKPGPRGPHNKADSREER